MSGPRKDTREHALAAMFNDCLHGAQGCECECQCPCSTCTDERAAAIDNANHTARDIAFYQEVAS